MSIYVISDLHLSFSPKIDKPMDVFGADWVNHAERVKANWLDMVSENDTVVIAGDISWALKLEDAIWDLDWLSELSGNKVLIKGNHDLWWSSITKLTAVSAANINFLQNNFFEADGYAICGSRGWVCPGDEHYSEQDEKIYKREILRLRASLTSAKDAGFTDIIGVLHFPPTNDKLNESGFTELFEEFGVSSVFYGHLHGTENFRRGLTGNFNGVEYKLVSIDYLRCKPHKIEHKQGD
jgi:predicted phosphohydrolase